MSDDLDKILNDIEIEKQMSLREQESARSLLDVDEKTAEQVLDQRRNKVSEFKLNVDIDDKEPLTSDEKWTSPEHKPENPENSEAKNEDTQIQNQRDLPDLSDEAPNKGKPPKKPKTGGGCAKGIIYATIVIAVSGVLAYFLIAGGLDLVGIRSNKSDVLVPVTLSEEQINDTAQVARVLKQAGIIDQPLIFRLYCRITNADGTFVPQDDASLSADMGYRAIINILRTKVREVVKITFQEGMTISEIATRLERNKVCSASDFYLAMDNIDDSSFDFLAEIPDSEEDKHRFHRMEGYIFPDTYEFYVNSSGEAALRKFLSAFNMRVDATVSASIKAKDMSLHDVIILASIIQWEAAKLDDMYKVSRIMHNRMQKPSVYPRLEVDATRRYINMMTPPVGDKAVENLYYDTYKRIGLPVGPINNPGMDAIDAAINPTDDSSVKDHYFFATDLKTGITYYSKTLAQHEAICRRYKIGMYKYH